MDWENIFIEVQGGDSEAEQELYRYYYGERVEEGRLGRYVLRLVNKYHATSEGRFKSDLHDIVHTALEATIRKLKAGEIRVHFAIGSFVYQSTFYVFLHFLEGYRREHSVSFMEVDEGHPRNLPLGPEERTPSQTENDPTQLHEVIQRERQRRISEGIKTLSRDEQLIFEMRVFDGLSFRDIGKRLGQDDNHVKARYHYAITKLRRLIQE